MWIITGPFDEDHSEGQAPDSMSILPFTLPTLSSPPEQKLLKTGKEYTLGRRDNPLQIKSKAISKAHALFLVAPCSQEDAVCTPSPQLPFHPTAHSICLRQTPLLCQLSPFRIPPIASVLSSDRPNPVLAYYVNPRLVCNWRMAISFTSLQASSSG